MKLSEMIRKSIVNHKNNCKIIGKNYKDGLYYRLVKKYHEALELGV